MRSKSKILMGAALAASVIALLLSSIPGDLSAEQTYDQDYGEFWSDTLKFVFSGDAAQAQEIVWDFGDGNTSTEWNPEHKYDEPGVYYVTQVVSNSYNGGSSSTAVYKVTVNGHPYIEVVMPGGEKIRHEVRYNTYPDAIPQPVLDGRTFVGFFSDADLTQEYTFDKKITSPVTIYAGFDGDVPAPVPASVFVIAPEVILSYAPVILSIGGLIITGIGAYARRPIMILVGLLIMSASAYIFVGGGRL